MTARVWHWIRDRLDVLWWFFLRGRRCQWCGAWISDDVDQFELNKPTPDGRVLVRAYCPTCGRLVSVFWISEERG